MPITTTWEPKGFVGVHIGDITGEELRESVAEMLSETAYEVARYAIVDLRRVDTMQANAEDFEYLNMARLGSYASNPGLKIAILVPDRLRAWADKQLQVLNNIPPESRHEMQVFASMERAREWAEA